MNVHCLDVRVAPSIIPISNLERLVRLAPDKEILLTIKLCYHCYVRAGELSGLGVSAFYFGIEGKPLWVSVGSDKRDPLGRTIPIDPFHRPILRALLPAFGPAFTNANPFGRLQRFAGGVGIRVSRGAALRSCVHFARYAGLPGAKAAAFVGRRCPFVAARVIGEAAQAEARKYFGIDFAVGVYRPQYCGPEALPLEEIRRET
jgi:integrase